MASLIEEPILEKSDSYDVNGSCGSSYLGGYLSVFWLLLCGCFTVVASLWLYNWVPYGGFLAEDV